MSRKNLIRIFLVVWSAAVAAGFFLLVRYEFKSENISIDSESVPLSIAQLLQHEVVAELTADLASVGGANTGEPVAYVFLHPHCPCSRATVNEIERSLTSPGGGQIVFISFASEELGSEWNNSALVAKASALSGGAHIFDFDSRLAQAFGARVSGEVLAYDSQGILAYHGGVTASRGHEGPNEGINAMTAVLNGDQPLIAAQNAYGCYLNEINVLEEHEHPAEHSMEGEA